MPIELIMTAAILFVASVLLMMAELFIPAHGLLVVLSCGLAVAGLVACFMVSPLVGVLGVAVVLCVAPVALYFAVRYYPQSPVGRRIVLRQPEPGSIKGLESETSELAAMTGQKGIAISTLRPAGTCDFSGRRIACVSEGSVISAGALVVVIGVSGMQLLVRQVVVSS